MPPPKTAEYDAQIFRVLISQYKIPTKDISAAWKQVFPKEEEAPSAGSLDQHINKLRKKKDGKTPSKAPTKTMTALPRSAAATPNKAESPKEPSSKTGIPRARTPKTPVSSGKRKRTELSETEVSDADDTEQELTKPDLTNIGRRSSLARSRKDVNKKYKEDSTDDEDDEDMETLVRGAGEPADSKMGGSKNGGSSLDEFINSDGVGEQATNHRAGGSLKKRRYTKEDSGDESDVSDFSARFS